MRIEEDLSSAHLRLSETYIENLPWHKLIEKYDRADSLFYLDPPYWETEGYGVDFNWEEYEKIKDYMDSCKGKILLSINNHPAIAELFKDFVSEEVGITYTVGGATNKKETSELIIRNRQEGWGGMNSLF